MSRKGLTQNSASHRILKTLSSVTEAVLVVNNFSNHPLYFDPELAKSLSKETATRTLNRLKGKGLVDKTRIDNELIIKLTESGRELVGQEEAVWDGKWRIVIFDIPEQKRIIRNLFRRNLKKWGFKPLQKSVWISQRAIYDRLINYIQELKIDQYVLVMETDRIGPQILVK